MIHAKEPSTVPRVTLGIEKLISEGPSSYMKRVAVLSNQNTILPDGTTSWKALVNAGFPVVRLFGPEHGFSAVAQDTVSVKDAMLQGVEVVSLYGERKRPEYHHLQDLDAIIIDIQDIGCRYYTFLYTCAAVIEEASVAGVRIIVCDRPNPIGAHQTEGGALAAGGESEVGGYGLAVRHGMTVGEFACYLGGPLVSSYTSYLQEFKSNQLPGDIQVEVYWMQGYRRDMRYEHLGLPWKQPSPNLPTLQTASVYPGTCLFEGTNISEGRGTTAPFEIIGAPWLDADALREQLSDSPIEGAVFSVSEYVPTFSAYSGTRCRGVQLHVTDPLKFKPLLTGVHMLTAIRNQDADRFSWRPLWEDKNRSFIDNLAGTQDFRRNIEDGCDAAYAYGILCKNQRLFLEERSRYLHYEDVS